MKTKILLILIILIILGAGGFLAYKSIFAPQMEEKTPVVEKKLEEEKVTEEQPEEQIVLPEEEEEEEQVKTEEAAPVGGEPRSTEVEREGKLPSVWTIEGVVVPGGYCDAEVVKLSDGRYRMYYGLDPRTYPENINIVSAVSSDGLNWIAEPGIRLPEGHIYAMPSVIELLDGRWRMYYNSGGIRSAVSDDGLNFQAEGLRLATNLQGPTVTRLDDGRYRMYLQDGDEPPPPTPPTSWIRSAISSDGLSWEMEPGIRLDGTKPLFYGMSASMISTPHIVKLFDGSFQLYFMAGSEKMDEGGKEGVYRAESVDGLSFSNITFLFGKYIDEEGRKIMLADPCAVKIEGGWRVYFGSDYGPFNTGISSAVGKH